MNDEISYLKNLIDTAHISNRLSLIQELCALPAFWGEPDELHFLAELETLSAKSSGKGDDAKVQWLLARYYLGKGEFESAVRRFETAMFHYKEVNDADGVIDCELGLCEIDFKQGNFGQAQNRAELTLKLVMGKAGDLVMGHVWHIMGWVNQGLGNYAESILYFNLAKQAYQKVSFDMGVANCCNGIGNVYRIQGKNEEALPYYQNALRMLAISGNRYRIASCYNNMGLAFTDMGKYQEAIDSQLNALKITKEIDDKLGISAAYSNLGLLYYRQGNLTEALNNQLQALKLKEEMGLKQGIGTAHMMIGNIHHRQANYPEALKAFLLSLEIAEAIGDKRGMADAYNNIGVTYEHQGKNADAIRHYGLSMAIRQELGNQAHMVDLYNNIGNIHIKSKKPDLAFASFLRGLDILKTHYNKPAVANLYLSLGNAYNQVADYVQANKYLTGALDLATEMGQKDIIRNSLLGLTETCKKLNDFEKALDYFEQYFKIEKELTGLEVKKQITDLNFKFDVEQKAVKAEIERLRNIELKEALEQLKLEKERSEQLLGNQLSELKSTALKAQMNPHFVFNSLNSIQRYIWKSNPEKATEYLVSFAKLIRLVLENSRQALVTIEKDLLALDYYIQLEALRFENEFTYQIICDKGIDKAETQIPAMILQPFVENAIIHGLHPLKKPGKLTIRLKRKDEDVLFITIEDNGVGRKNQAERNVAPGHASHQSLGMQVTQERIEMLTGTRAGKVNIFDLYDNDEAPKGTRVEIELAI